MSFIDGIFRLLNHVVGLLIGVLRYRSILNGGGSCSMILTNSGVYFEKDLKDCVMRSYA